MDDCESIRKVLTAVHRHESVYISLQRSHTLGVETHRIKTHIVKVGDLLVNGARLRLRLRDLCKKLIQAHLVGLTQLVECTIACKLRLQRIRSLPAAGSILIEVVIESHALIKICRIDSRHLLSLLHVTTHHKGNCRKG